MSTVLAAKPNVGFLASTHQTLTHSSSSSSSCCIKNSMHLSILFGLIENYSVIRPAQFFCLSWSAYNNGFRRRLLGPPASAVGNKQRVWRRELGFRVFAKGMVFFSSSSLPRNTLWCGRLVGRKSVWVPEFRVKFDSEQSHKFLTAIFSSEMYACDHRAFECGFRNFDYSSEWRWCLFPQQAKSHHHIFRSVLWK